jgi:hypothetical protein
VARGVAAGEHAPAVAEFDRPPQVTGDQPSLAAHVERHPVRPEDDAGDAPVARQPPRPRRGDRRAEAHPAGAGAGGGVGQVVEVDAHRHVRLHRPQHRHLPGGEDVVGQLHQRVTLPLRSRAVVPGGAVGLHVRLQCRLQLLPADGVEVAAEADGSVGVLGQRQRPALGRVRLRPVGLQGGEVGVDHLHQRRVVGLDRHASEHAVDLAEVHPGGGERGQPLRRPQPGGLGDLLGRHQPGVVRLGQHRQVLQRPPVADQPGGHRRRQPAVPAQPRRHRLLPVPLGCL